MERRYSLSDRVIWLLTGFLFASFYIFETYAWGRYIFLGTSFAILVFWVFKKGVRKNIGGSFKLGAWHYHLIALSAFSLISSLWALSSEDAVQKAITLLQILICLSFLYLYYQDNIPMMKVLQIIKWAGYGVTVYAFVFYGYDFIVSSLDSEMRLDNEFSNVNSIGMLSAIAIVIQVYELLYYRKIELEAVFCIPSIIMVAATQSRKALVIGVVGIILVLIYVNSGKNFGKSLFKIVLALTICAFVFQYLSQLAIFNGVSKRMMGLVALYSGVGDAGESATIRDKMVHLGWEYFLANPIGGVGFGCPRILAKTYLNFDAYLHNNYIELLAGGGIIGAAVYYSMYVYLLTKTWKLRLYKNDEYGICLIVMLLLLIVDWGSVSCYSKSTYFYFMLFNLQVKNLMSIKRRSQ